MDISHLLNGMILQAMPPPGNKALIRPALLGNDGGIWWLIKGSLAQKLPIYERHLSKVKSSRVVSSRVESSRVVSSRVVSSRVESSI